VDDWWSDPAVHPLYRYPDPVKEAKVIQREEKPYVHVDHRGSLYFLPAFLMVFTFVIQVSIQWLGVCLRSMGWTILAYKRALLPSFLNPPRKPPDPILPTSRKIGQMGRKIKRDGRKVKTRGAVNLGLAFCLSALCGAVTASQKTPVIATQADQALRSRIMLATHGGSLSSKVGLAEEDLQAVRAMIAEDPSGIHVDGDGFLVIADTGTSYNACGDIEDFVPGTITTLAKPIVLSGIAGDVVFKQEGTVHYEWLTTTGEVITKEYKCLYSPDLKVRLMSPQVLLDDLRDNNSRFSLGRFGVDFNWHNEGTVNIPIHPITRLPLLQTFRDAKATAKKFAFNGCVTDENNQNLTAAQKLLLRYHFRLGHIAMATVQWIGRQGWLGTLGQKMGKSCKHPKCASCLYGKSNVGRQHEPSIGARMRLETCLRTSLSPVI